MFVGICTKCVTYASTRKIGRAGRCIFTYASTRRSSDLAGRCIERMNEFSFAYMVNPNLYPNKVFKDQVKSCLGNTFGADTNKHINNILLRHSTRVIALIVNYEHGSFNTSKVFKVLSCVIYTIIDKYVCIDYLCTETNIK